MLVGVLHHSMCDMKAALMSAQLNINRELMVYEFEFDLTLILTRNWTITPWKQAKTFAQYSNQRVKEISLGLQ